MDVLYNENPIGILPETPYLSAKEGRECASIQY
jgi:hypothetical protein